MKRLMLIVLAMIVLALPVQAETPPTNEMQMYHIIMVKEGPNWKSQGSEEGMDVRMQVIDAIRKSATEGLLVSAGLVNDETNVEFIVIMDVETKTEAYNEIMSAKNVKNGFFSADIYSYFAPKGLTFQKK